jgi:hypothetical protein
MRDSKVIWEASTQNRLEALSIHERWLDRQVGQDSTDIRLDAEWKKVKELQEEMKQVAHNPRNRLVEVLKSRVVQYGAVGRVVYVHDDKNLCKVEFGNGEQVYVSRSNVNVIDWDPLPPIVPMVGELVVDQQTGEEVVAAEWRVTEVRVQPIGRPEDTYTRDRKYVSRRDAMIHM